MAINFSSILIFLLWVGQVHAEPWRLSTSQTPHGQGTLAKYKDASRFVSGGGGFGPVGLVSKI